MTAKKKKLVPMSEISKVVVRAAVMARDAAIRQCDLDIQLARKQDGIDPTWGSWDGENWYPDDVVQAKLKELAAARQTQGA